MTKRKSEIKLLKEKLKKANEQNNISDKCEILRRIGALINSGIDTSRLLDEIIAALEKADTTCKKIIFCIFTVYARKSSRDAQAVIDALVKEINTKDAFPPVRGLAIKTLSSIGTSQVLKPLMPIIASALKDPADYVRSHAVLSLSRVYYISPPFFFQNSYYTELQSMIKDHHPQVCANAIKVLQAITAEETFKGSPVNEPFTVTKPLLFYLINRMQIMNNSQRCQTAGLILEYTPETNEEALVMIHALEPYLYGTHGGLILACLQVLLHMMTLFPEISGQVQPIFSPPFVKFIATTHSTEMGYVFICHAKLVAQRYPECFSKHFRLFLCNEGDPPYLKSIKIDVLVLIADDQNGETILSELMYYDEDRWNRGLVVKSIRGMCKIARRISHLANRVIEHFTGLLDLGFLFLRGVTLTEAINLFRKYRTPEVVAPFLVKLIECFKQAPFEDEASKLALLFFLGEFGEHADEAPYIIETFIEGLLDELPSVRLQMLTSSVTLFFKRPPEMQTILGKVLHLLTNDFSNADVLDRALFYYRLLINNPSAAADIICGVKGETETFEEDKDVTLVNKLFSEFNTLSVIYGEENEKFQSKWSNELMRRNKDEGDNDSDTSGSSSSSNEGSASMTSLDEAVERSEMEYSPFTTDTYPEIVRRSTSDYLLSKRQIDGLELRGGIEIGPSEYQNYWDDKAVTADFHLKLEKPLEAEVLEETLEDKFIFTLASGAQGDLYKFYMYGQVQNTQKEEGVILLELTYNKKDSNLHVIVKCAEMYRPSIVVLFNDVLHGI